MRILQVHTHYRHRGGEDTVVESERALLIAAGHEVETMELTNPSGGIAAARSLALAPWNRAAARSVVERAERVTPDVVHVHNTWFALSPAVFPALSGIGLPIVATVHNYRLGCVNAMHYRNGSVCEDCVGRSAWRGVVHGCYRGSRPQSAVVAVTISGHRARHTWGRDVTRIIALTGFAADLLCRAGVPRDRIVIKPNSVADPGPRRLSPSASRDVLFVGRLTEEKGILDLVDAWSGRDAGDLRLRIVGDGPLRAEVASRVHLRTDIEMTGWVTPAEVTDMMKSSRGLVMPSRWFEGMPMVMVGAAAAGLPTLVADHGALAEVVGEGGWAVGGNSPTDLAESLGQFDDPVSVDQAGVAARERYLAQHHPAVDLQALESIYASAVDATSPWT